MEAKQWSNITVGQYQRAAEIISEKEWTKLKKTVHLVALVTGKPLSEVRGWTPSKYGREAKAIEFLFEPIDMEMKLERKFKLDKWYWVSFEITSLTAGQQDDISGVLAGQYIDAQSTLERCNDMAQIIPRLLAIICLPMRWTWKGRQPIPYDGDLNEREQVMKDLPMKVAYPIAVFFYAVWKELMGDLPNLTAEEITAEILRPIKDRDLKTSTKHGGGIAPLMSSVEQTR